MFFNKSACHSVLYCLSTIFIKFQHNFKKLRNNLLKSSSNGKIPRHFKLDDKEILWSHLKDSYMYDIEHNPIQTFKYLTPQHFDPGSAEKMRNYLADDVLGKRMIEVVQVCISQYTN
jgi:hypothetical protein